MCTRNPGTRGLVTLHTPISTRTKITYVSFPDIPVKTDSSIVIKAANTCNYNIDVLHGQLKMIQYFRLIKKAL